MSKRSKKSLIGMPAAGTEGEASGSTVASAVSGAVAPEARGSFGGFIGPKNLVALVDNAAPWLFDGSHPASARVPPTSGSRLDEHAHHPLGWWSILKHADLVRATHAPTAADLTDYFALCLACHFASVATYVPTDVDAKIRHALWLDQTDADELRRMRELALAIAEWDTSGVSTRAVTLARTGARAERHSGHDGEWLSVLCGGLVGHWKVGDATNAARFEDAIDAELSREARAFDEVARESGRETALAGLAAILTHNAGDVVQVLGSKHARYVPPAVKLRFTDLARERFERYGGAFGRAAAVYRAVMASEGHRNYPLRELKQLRRSPELLLPIAPFLDDWGSLLARWPGFNVAERANIVGGLINGCRKIDGQEGYYRALAGFDRAFPAGLDSRELTSHLGARVRAELKDATLRKKIAVRRESFESSCAKAARAALAPFGRARRVAATGRAG
ncbi:MAG: hypothetical protein ABI640_15810 [Gammaproteobacteria bacterium]